MSEFSEALDNFIYGKQKQLKLINMTLTLKQLKELLYWIEITSKSHNRKCRIHLQNILLVFDLPKKYDGAQVPTGAITSKEKSVGVSVKNLPDLGLVDFHQYRQTSPLVVYVEEDEISRENREELEKSFADLFRRRNFWKSVKLENVQLLIKGERQYPSLKCHLKLLSNLNLQDCLENLTLSMIQGNKAKINMSGREQLVLTSKSLLDESEYKKKFCEFLIKAVKLESLDIMAGMPRSSFLQELTSALIMHPNLKDLELENLLLSERDYYALRNLLDKNFTISNLKVPEPEERLRDVHDSLIAKSKTPGYIRFKVQEITQIKLINVAIDAIENNKADQLTLVVGPEMNRQEIVRNKFDIVCSALPGVYAYYITHMKIYVDDFKLVVWRRLIDNPSQTVGSYLLKKAIQTENVSAVINLIEAGASLYEYYRVYGTRASLLSLLTDASSSSEWKKTLIAKLKQDLYLNFPSMQRLLSTDDTIRNGLHDIKAHLDNYLRVWLSRSQWSDFLKVLTGVYFCFPNRKDDLENAMEKFAKAVEVGSRFELSTTGAALEQFDQAVDALIKRAEKFKCGLLGQSELNDGLRLHGTKLKEAVIKAKEDLWNRHDKEMRLCNDRARKAENQLQELSRQLKEKDIKIEELLNFLNSKS